MLKRTLAVFCLASMISLPTLLRADDKAVATPAPAPKTTTAKTKGPALHIPPIYLGLNLTEDQKIKINDIENQRASAMADFEAKNGAHEAELKKNLEEARADKSKGNTKAINSELLVITNEKKGITDKYTAQIQALLTPEQKQALDIQNVFSGQMYSFRKAALTQQQKADVKARITKAVTATPPKDEKAHTEMVKNLHDAITTEVLTDAQRDLMNAKPAPKAAAAANSTKPVAPPK